MTAFFSIQGPTKKTPTQTWGETWEAMKIINYFTIQLIFTTIHGQLHFLVLYMVPLYYFN